MAFLLQDEERISRCIFAPWDQTPENRDSQRKCMRHNRPARRYINFSKSLLASFPAGVESDL